MAVFAIFGVRNASTAISAIERTLGVTFVGHESSYKGAYERAVLTRSPMSQTVLELRANRDPQWTAEDPAEDQYAERRFPAEQHLLFVGPTDDSVLDTLKGCGLVLLDRQEA